MACPTGRCALRRFDGHGSSSYRPTNPEAVRQFNSEMERMLAARAQQDAAWLQPAAVAAAELQQVAEQQTGATLLRQKTPEFGAAAAAGGFAAAKVSSAAAAIEQQPTGPCWSLSS